MMKWLSCKTFPVLSLNLMAIGCAYPQWCRYLRVCAWAKCWRCVGAASISTRPLFKFAKPFTKAHGTRFKAPKSKAGRRDITLPDILIEALREYRKAQLELRMKLGAGKLPDDALLFGDIHGKPPSRNAFSAAWSDFAERIGLPEVTFHALRHTHASQLIDAGADIVTISTRLGHAKPDITLRIYAHLFRKDDGTAAKAINAALITILA
jgi:integrase